MTPHRSVEVGSDEQWIHRPISIAEHLGFRKGRHREPNGLVVLDADPPFPSGAADLPLEEMYRLARASRIYDGPDEVHKGVVARGVLQGYGLKRPRR